MEDIIQILLKYSRNSGDYIPDYNFESLAKDIQKYAEAKAGHVDTIVMRWEKGQPPTDDDGNSLPVMGKILHNGNYHVAPVNLWNYKWHWIESGKKMSEDFTVIEWMYYPNA